MRGGRYIFCATVRQELPCPGVTRRTALWSSDFPPRFRLRCRQGMPRRLRVGNAAVVWLVATTQYGVRGARSSREPLAVDFLLDAVLFELLVQVAARRVDHFRRFRDVPVVLAQLLHQIRAFRGVLEF